MSKELPVVVQYRIEDMGHIRCTPNPFLEPNKCPLSGNRQREFKK